MDRSKKPRIIKAAQHGIDFQDLDEGVVSILASLNDAGYQAYLVGGCIRDILAGEQPKDFDIVTNARPEQIKKVFPKKSMIIGRRFALVHVRLGWNRIVEVATFRGKHADKIVRNKFGRWLSKWWIYGSIDSDVWRRDTTINALYMAYPSGNIIDYVSGFDDIAGKKIQMIGQPEIRYQEDPVRVLRVIRLRAKLGFAIEEQTKAHLKPCSSLLANVSPSRMYGEILRTFHGGFGVDALKSLDQHHLLRILFPKIDLSTQSLRFIETCLANADQRVMQGLPVSAAFLFAIFLWHPLQLELRKSSKGSKKYRFDMKTKAILQKQHRVTALPKRVWFSIVQIWRLQHLFLAKNHKAVRRLMEHQLFRAAYDFFLLRAEYDSELDVWAKWWATYLQLSSQEQAEFDLPIVPEVLD